MSLSLERPAQRAQSRQIVARVLAAGLLVTLFAPLFRALADMPRADVTFANSTRWAIEVDLVLDEGDSRVGLGTISADVLARIEEIGEPGGDAWTFEFAAWGRTATITVSDDQLRADRYRVAVPRSLVQELEAANAPRSPYRSSR
jgi:hypothetical protein